MRILVTGVSGFSGAHVARALARAGHDVVGAHRRDTAFLAEISEQPNVAFVRGDLAEIVALPGPFDVVVHIAATSPALGISYANLVHDNVDATRALIAAALTWKCRSFIFFSSLSAFGEINASVLNEECPVHNPDVYGATKFLCEKLLSERADQLPSLSLRLPGILGPGAHRNWISHVAALLQRGDVVPAFNLDAPFNNAVHIDDLSKLVVSAAGCSMSGADSVVLGARGRITTREAIQAVARGLGVEARLEERAASSKASFTIDCSRAISRWGYEPTDIEGLLVRYGQSLVAAH